MRTLAIAAVFAAAACSSAGTSIPDGGGLCRPPLVCDGPTCTFSTTPSALCMPGFPVQVGRCGDYDVVAYHTGQGPVFRFYDRDSGQLVAIDDPHQFIRCGGPSDFVIPPCDASPLPAVC